MVEYNDLKPQRLDDLLAEFTDRLMSMNASEDLPLDSQDQELKALQETVILLKRALADERPSPVMAERIRRSLSVEWKRADRKYQKAPGLVDRAKDFLGSLGQSVQHSRQRSFALSFAAVAVLVVLVVLLAAPELVEPITGVAWGSEEWVPAVIILLALFVLGLLWLLRSKD
ncbi:MAG: hypothetical protein AB1894_21835 [Chloroflexota bacterium]